MEKKEDTKEKIGRSPDDGDAYNLAYLEGVEFVPPPLAPLPQPRSPFPEPQARRRDDRHEARGPFRGNTLGPFRR